MTERETNRRNEVTGRPWAVDELFLLDRGNESRQNGGDARFQDAALELHNLRAALTAEVAQREAAERERDHERHEKETVADAGQAMIRHLRAERDTLTAALADCYRLTGADPDGNPDALLASHAVAEVARLRREHDAAVAALEAAAPPR